MAVAGDRVVVTVSGDVDGSELVSIVGASGVGKTTIVKLLIGAETADRGRVLVDGVDLATLRGSLLQLYRRSIGIVYQDYKLLPRKTVAENVAYALEVCGERTSVVRAVIPNVLKLVNLSGQEEKFPAALSGGERQRVAIARALVHRPKLLIADEPTGNLDPHTTGEIVELLQKIHRLGTTVILTTHSPEVVNALKKRVISLDHGRIVRDVPEGTYEG